jgi:hypothetical protein
VVYHEIDDVLALVMTAMVGLLVRCTMAPSSRRGQDALVTEAASKMQQMRAVDHAPGDLVWCNYSYGMFPEVTKEGLVVGAAYGRRWCTSGVCPSVTATCRRCR